MRSKLARLSMTLALVLASLDGALAAPSRTDSKTMAYHNGPVMTGTQDVYFVWYGCWTQSGCGGADARSSDLGTVTILTDFMSNLGGSPYFQINAGYPDGYGHAPSGGLLYAGAVMDSYSRGQTLTEGDLAAVIADRIVSGDLPQDPAGIYVVLASSEVTVSDSTTQFCLTCCDFHGTGTAFGSSFRYVFVGNPARCPSGCASQFRGAASRNANFAADAMAAWLAQGTFGPTHTVTNPDGLPAESNMKLGTRNYLLQQNWVNTKKGHCALDISQ